MKSSQLSSSSQSMSSMTTSEESSIAPEDHIKVCVRIRPVVRSERDIGETLCWQWENNQIIQMDKPIMMYNNTMKSPPMPSYPITPNTSRSSYIFDHLFYPEHTNRDIFDLVVKSVVNSVMNGFHGSVFTYGQTSSGKTFTMTGNHAQPGIIPQAINFCFDSIHSFSDREFLVRVSYLEIYNEQVKDLLNSEVVAIKIQHDPKNGTVISGVKEQVVVNSEQTISLIKAGEAHRHVGSTDMNEKSSRAHTLFKLTIESRERTGSSVPSSSNGYSPVRVSCLNLVDLAGSENAKQTNSKGDRALEARYINQSLLTLSTIIHKLSEEKPGMTPLTRRQHLPYRDSKLTRILQPSLDGNAQIAVICTISPVQSCADETNNTLKFATRAKSVKMNAKVNDVMDEKTLLKVYREEIETLKAKLFELEMQSKLYNEYPKMRLPAHHNNDDDDDEQETLLQMITEMESMILKADAKRLQGGLTSGSSSGMSTPTENIAFARANSYRNKAASAASSSAAISSSSPGIAMPESSGVVEPPSASTKSNLSTVSKLSTTSKLTTDSLPNKLPKTPAKVVEKRASTTTSAAAPTSADKRAAEEAKKTKSRFGFGFGFKQKSTTTASSSSPIPTAIPSPEPSTSSGIEAEKLRRKLAMIDNRQRAEDEHNHGFEGRIELDSDMEGEDYNSTDGNDRQSSIINRVQSFKGDDVGDKVLFGVSKMLAALKLHIGKSRGQSNATAPPIRKGSNDDNGAGPSTIDISSSVRIDRLELDLRLKEADNRFLQEELEKKDKMLAMLTEGLREVESSQQEWLAANQGLSDDLERALFNSASLLQENRRLKEMLAEVGMDAASIHSALQKYINPRLEEY